MADQIIVTPTVAGMVNAHWFVDGVPVTDGPNPITVKLGLTTEQMLAEHQRIRAAMAAAADADIPSPKELLQKAGDRVEDIVQALVAIEQWAVEGTDATVIANIKAKATALKAAFAGQFDAEQTQAAAQPKLWYRFARGLRDFIDPRVSA